MRIIFWVWKYWSRKFNQLKNDRYLERLAFLDIKDQVEIGTAQIRLMQKELGVLKTELEQGYEKSRPSKNT